MTKKIIFTFIVTLFFSIQPIFAQRKVCKSADIAFERKQYNTAIEKYKKAMEEELDRQKCRSEKLERQIKWYDERENQLISLNEKQVDLFQTCSLILVIIIGIIF